MTASNGERGTLALDTAFELLADRQRRHAISYLTARPNEAVAFETLVDEVASGTLVRSAAATPSTDDPASGRDRDWQSVAVSLRHVHLPKLEAADVVDYDPDADEIRYRGSSLVEDLLRQVGELH